MSERIPLPPSWDPDDYLKPPASEIPRVCTDCGATDMTAMVRTPEGCFCRRCWADTMRSAR